MIQENQRIPSFAELEDLRHTYENYKNKLFRD